MSEDRVHDHEDDKFDPKIAVPLSPISSKLTTRAHDLPSPFITKSVQTFYFPGRSVETVTSNTELPKCEPVPIIANKSKSLNDFRLKPDFKSEIIAWLDDTSDPRIIEIKDIVLRNLKFRLQGVPVTGDEKKIKVKVGDCLKTKKRVLIEPSSIKVNKKEPINSTESQSAMKFKQFDKNEFKVAVDEWLNNVSIKKQDILSKPVEEAQNLNTFVDRIKYLAFVKSKLCSEQAIRTEILGILDEVIVEINACDKAAFLNKLTDALMCKLDNALLGEIKTKPSTCNKSNVNQAIEKETKDLQTQKVLNPDLIKQTIVDLVDILKDSVNNNIGFEEIASTLYNTTKFEPEEILPQRMEKRRKKLAKKTFNTQPLTVFMVQNLSRNYVSKTSDKKVSSQHSIGSILDRDIEENLINFKTQLAQQIDQWLTDFAMLKAEDTDFRRAVILDLANDIVERQKYLEFNKNKNSSIDELEHLKYLIFKWMKRYVGEENMETVHHAVQLMEMIRNIPVPMLSRSRVLLKKSSSYLCCKKADCEPGTSADTSKESVQNSKSDSGIHDRESLSSAPSFIVIDSEPLSKKKNNDTIKQKDPKSPVNRSNKPDLSFNADKINTENVVQNNVGQSSCVNKEEHSSQDSFVSSRSQDDYHESNSDTRCKDHMPAPGISISITKDDVNTSNVTRKKNQNDSIYTNYVIHNISKNTSNRRDKPREETNEGNSSMIKKKLNKTQDSSNASKVFVSCESVKCAQNKNDSANKINPQPGPSGLVTPVPPHSGRPSSAADQLMAEWRPHPVFTPPEPGRPLLDKVQEEFKEYLTNWCEQIPIPANTCNEIEVAAKLRLGILNGIWRTITILKAQPAVFQNKFYYEDVLGKEIDGLLDCLPQTHELQEKKYPLKSQLLDKISEMNDFIKETETPDNYKEMVARKAELLKEQKLRIITRLDREPPAKIFEEMLKYCTLDDFLRKSNYKETNEMVGKAYKNKLLQSIQAYIDEFKKTHDGKEMEELFGVFKKCDIFEKLGKVPLPTEDEIKENADEILLGLEIEEWVKDLPLIKNDEPNEQRQRARLRDALTKKIYEMGKSRVNIANCCEDTEMKHEISYFLDMVPLEKDQDLNINKMVDELTNRLKNRHGGGRRKSVAFQDRSRLLNRSEYTLESPASDIYSPSFQGDEDAQYQSIFKNPPLCSTRIGQTGEWDLSDDQDAQYRAMFKDGVPCSSMIEPQAGYGPGSPMAPDFRHSYGQAQHFDYPPRQFNESARSGYSVRGSVEYPDVMGHPRTPQQGSQSPGLYKSVAVMPNIPPDSQFQSLQGSRMSGAVPPDIQFQSLQGSRMSGAVPPDIQFQSLQRSRMSGAVPPGIQFQSLQGSRMAAAVPPDSQFQSLHGSRISGAPCQGPRMTGQFNQSRGVGWIPPEEASGLVSVRDDLSPQMLPPLQRFSNEPPAFSHHISQAERSAAQGFVPMTSYGHREPQGFISMASDRPGEIQPASYRSFPPNEFMQPQPAAFIPEESRCSRRSKPVSIIDPSMRQGTVMDPSMRQVLPDGSVEIDHSVGRGPFDVSIEVHEAPRSRREVQDGSDRFVSMVSQQRQNRSVRQPIQNQPCIRITSARDRTDLDEIQEVPSRSAHLSHIQQPEPGRQSSRQPTDRMEAASREPSSPQRARLIASNAPSTEISNQPGFYSTPNQQSHPPPHNIRERRQLEKERVAARRVDMDADEADEGEERCHCRQRFKQWKGHNCQTCDDCLQGRFHPYLYPFPYMYPPYGRHPPPPYCRR
ncbi:uncharacterized protein LOC134676861 [Cydia fagiglandana]|uniref:uncharacterized protein LOC134676861 n=1 Tax=Cydia fagiglandana TaxID=1458189 RepID=UPI002FEDF4EF